MIVSVTFGVARCGRPHHCYEKHCPDPTSRLGFLSSSSFALFWLGLWSWSRWINTASGCARFRHSSAVIPFRPEINGSSIPTLVDDDAGEFPLSEREHHE